MRSNLCVICGKDMGYGRKGNSKVKVGSRYMKKGFAHFSCLEEHRKKIKLADRVTHPNMSLTAVKKWREMQNGKD